ncbi:hypothetical protein BELL_1016g00050 [Botrytis elliptica]|uniref:Uncharacterized protein n=1 Tax=Botrytis elliptica TaxID=278938 RepID=A0A4Z1J8F0_9HELO|nr:hypothetical protein BELL_1016g00050 [Botrytis elliptica]
MAEHGIHEVDQVGGRRIRKPLLHHGFAVVLLSLACAGQITGHERFEELEEQRIDIPDFDKLDGAHGFENGRDPEVILPSKDCPKARSPIRSNVVRLYHFTISTGTREVASCSNFVISFSTYLFKIGSCACSPFAEKA